MSANFEKYSISESRGSSEAAGPARFERACTGMPLDDRTVRAHLAQALTMLIAGLGFASACAALSFELDYGSGLEGTLNSFVTLGAALRLEPRAGDLLGKSNQNPDTCGTRTVNGQSINFNSCQGINQYDVLPAQALVAAPGQFTRNADDGNWNYDRHDLTQAPLKLTQDLSLSYGSFGGFARWMWFHDFVNADFTEFHPNEVGPTTPASEPSPFPLLPLTGGSYGAGEARRRPRADAEAVSQIGTQLQLLDAYVYGVLPFIGDRELLLKVGRQTLSWGESTLLVVNSLNQVNPVNVNSLFRTGFTADEVFTPVEMILASTNITDYLGAEIWWQWRWEPAEIPTPGSLYSTLDLGSNNLHQYVHIGFGGGAEDPLRRAKPLNNPLSLLTPTTTTGLRAPDRLASDHGQWGITLRYFAEELGSGTDLGFYYMNYHSKLPYASFFAGALSCARTHPRDNGTGSATGLDATSLETLVAACPNLPAVDLVVGGLAPLDLALDEVGGLIAEVAGLPVPATGEASDAVPIDTVRIQLEYPEDIQLFGMSFNTTIGDWGVQGELAYRPNLPVQVDAEDLVFAALGTSLTSCHRYRDSGSPCGGPQGDPLSQSGINTFNLVPASGSSPTGDGGDAPSVQRAFPSFITGYRGVTVGENTPKARIRGYEAMQVLQYNLGGTYTLGKTANPIGADQILLIFEIGAAQILNMPARTLIQFESPGTFRHASAGVVDAADPGARADAPGCFDGICIAGADGLRFNPQRETRDYASSFSWGYRTIAIIRYGNVRPGISIEPFVVWAHDINGIAPGPGENFVEGRQNLTINIETRYKNSWSFNLGYALWAGGGSQNLLRDRDTAQFFVRYQF